MRFEDIGARRIINACGTVTRLGGAPLREEALEAYRAAAEAPVSIEELQTRASRQLAEWTGAEAGIVASGAAAALTLGAAAMLAGLDASRMESLPHAESFPHEILVAREHRSGYDHAVRASGAQLVEVGLNEVVSGAGVRRVEAWEYEAAITEKTAGILYVFCPGCRPRLSEVVELAKRQSLPVLVDAAGELPPRENLRKLSESGADLIAFSGGKAIGGPQATGLLLGRKDLIASALLQMLDMDDHPELWDPPSDLIDRARLKGMPRHGISTLR